MCWIYTKYDIKKHRIFKSRYMAVFCSEFFCTMLFFTCVTSNNANFVLARGSYSSVGATLGAGLSIMCAIQMGYMISGSHMNPFISFFSAMLGAITWKEWVVYAIAQLLGSYCAAAVTFAVFYGTTFVISTAIMSLTIHAVIEKKNGIPLWIQPFLLGIGQLVTIFPYSFNAGASLNAAKDLGMRLFLLCAGYGWDVFSFNGYTWFWIPLIFPFIGGGLIATFLYKILIDPFLPELEEKPGEISQKYSNSTEFSDVDTYIPSEVVIEKVKV